MCLYRIAEALKPISIGEEILKKALSSPLRKIIENAGEDYAEIIKDMPKGQGYDAKAKSLCGYDSKWYHRIQQRSNALVSLTLYPMPANLITSHASISEYTLQKIKTQEFLHWA